MVINDDNNNNKCEKIFHTLFTYFSQKPIDKLQKICYNIITKGRERKKKPLFQKPFEIRKEVFYD